MNRVDIASTSADQSPKRRILQQTNSIDSNSDSSSSIMILDENKDSDLNRDGLAINNRANYNLIYYFTQALGIGIFILLIVWSIVYLGGIGFSSPSQVFNFHPLLLYIGFIFIYSNAILIFRTRNLELKSSLKIYHTILNGSAIIVSIFGSFAAIYFHHKANITHFYSLHSWLGITTWLFFLLQFSSAFITFLFPGLSGSIRAKLMPFHRFFGIAIFVLAMVTCITGLNEKAIFAFKNPAYSSMAFNGILTNLIGLLLICYCAAIVYLVTKENYKRKPLSEEQVINLSFDFFSHN